MKKIFTYEQALGLLPEVQRRTTSAVELIATLAPDAPEEVPSDVVPEFQRVVSEWAESVLELGVEVKGLWLVDFDSGSGYYCWRHPEPTLEFFHGYEEGFAGRVKLN